MPVDEDDSDNHGRKASSSSNASSTHHPPQQWWSMPTPIRRLFDKFPLRTYPANKLPQRATGDRSQHLLYVFTTPEAARRGNPSFNPGCLKWQVSFWRVPSIYAVADLGVILDISEGLRSRVQDRAVEQPRITHRGLTFCASVGICADTTGGLFVAHRLEQDTEMDPGA